MAKRNPRPIPPLSQKDIDRFWKYVDKSPGLGPNGDCWEWRGATNNSTKVNYKWQYGVFSLWIEGKSVHFLAHRIAFAIQKGDDPAPLQSLHHCDNTLCCRGEHLFKGTNDDNRHDSIRKKRHAFGDRHNSRTHPELLPRGDRNGSRTHPERLRRGDDNTSRKHPERMPRGDAHWTHRHPELVARGERHYSRTRPESVTRGERNGMAVLTDAIALEILGRFTGAPGELGKLATEYHVGKMTIWRLVKRKSFTYLRLTN